MLNCRSISKRNKKVTRNKKVETTNQTALKGRHTPTVGAAHRSKGRHTPTVGTTHTPTTTNHPTKHSRHQSRWPPPPKNKKPITRNLKHAKQETPSPSPPSTPYTHKTPPPTQTHAPPYSASSESPPAASGPYAPFVQWCSSRPWHRWRAWVAADSEVARCSVQISNYSSSGNKLFRYLM